MSSHVVAYREICLLEYALGVFFGSTDLDIKIHDRFELSKQYDAKLFLKSIRRAFFKFSRQKTFLNLICYIRADLK